MRNKSSNAIHNRIQIALLIAILPSLLVGFLFYRSVVNQIHEDVTRDLSIAAESTAKDASHKFHYLSQNLNNLTKLKIFLVALEYQRFEGIKDFFNSVVKSDSNMLGMIFVDDRSHMKTYSQIEGLDDRQSKEYWRSLIHSVLFSEDSQSFGLVTDKHGRKFSVFRSTVVDSKKKIRGHILALYKNTLVNQIYENTTRRFQQSFDLKFDYILKGKFQGKSIIISETHPSNFRYFSEKTEFLTVCNKVNDYRMIIFESCLRVDKSMVSAHLSSQQYTILLSLLASVAVILFIAVFLVRRTLRVSDIILNKLEQLSKGDYSLLKFSGNRFTDGYLKTTNKIILKLNRFRRDSEKNAENAAIVQTTQMLAHDVRQPFTMLKTGLELLKNRQSLEEVKRIVGLLSPEVEKSLKSVNNMIDDIMQIGRSDFISKKSHDIRKIVKRSTHEILSFHKYPHLKIDYDYASDQIAMLDEEKTLRVIKNIFSNAIESLNGKGHIWFKTQSVKISKQEFIQLTIGNNGPRVKKEDQERIFKPFFTSKRNGTGLGLAIAHKVITAHGGKIWLESSESRGVEFHMTFLKPKKEEIPEQPQRQIFLVEKQQSPLQKQLGI